MTAYVIFIKEQTLDQQALDLYADQAPAALAGIQATVLSAYQRLEVFEGAQPEGVVLFSFPSFEAATRWYHGAAYQAIIGYRLKGAIYRGFVVDGSR